MPHCYMHKQTGNQTLIKIRNVNTRLHEGPVFNTYKPNNEKSKANVLYHGAIEWNAIGADIRNLDYNHFKSHQKQKLVKGYLQG